jgi:hypothetical protein
MIWYIVIIKRTHNDGRWWGWSEIGVFLDLTFNPYLKASAAIKGEVMLIDPCRGMKVENIMSRPFQRQEAKR